MKRASILMAKFNDRSLKYVKTNPRNRVGGENRRGPWTMTPKKLKASPISTDIKVIPTITPNIYTTDLLSPDYDLSQWANKIHTIFGLGARYIPPSTFDYKLPANGVPEFAFIGRSNVGKSSLINSLLTSSEKSSKSLARVSKEPGCTRNINFYAYISESEYAGNSLAAGHCTYLVDLPGYGFAKAGKDDKMKWRVNIDNYVTSRDPSTLRRTYILIDCRRGLMEADLRMMLRLDSSAVPYQIILTKADACSKKEKEDALMSVFSQVFAKRMSSCLPYVHLVSALTGEGMSSLKLSMTEIIQQRWNSKGSAEAGVEDGENNLKLLQSELAEDLQSMDLESLDELTSELNEADLDDFSSEDDKIDGSDSELNHSVDNIATKFVPDAEGISSLQSKIMAALKANADEEDLYERQFNNKLARKRAAKLNVASKPLNAN